jgi:hypothetical protein
MTDKDAPDIVDADGNEPSQNIMDCYSQASQDDLKDGEKPLPSSNPIGGTIFFMSGPDTSVT